MKFAPQSVEKRSDPPMRENYARLERVALKAITSQSTQRSRESIVIPLQKRNVGMAFQQFKRSITISGMGD